MPHVRHDRPRFPTEQTRDRLVEAFMAAAFRGNIAALADLLADEAVLYADGVGKRPAAPAPGAPVDRKRRVRGSWQRYLRDIHEEVRGRSRYMQRVKRASK